MNGIRETLRYVTNDCRRDIEDLYAQLPAINIQDNRRGICVGLFVGVESEYNDNELGMFCTIRYEEISLCGPYPEGFHAWRNI